MTLGGKEIVVRKVCIVCKTTCLSKVLLSNAARPLVAQVADRRDHLPDILFICIVRKLLFDEHSRMWLSLVQEMGMLLSDVLDTMDRNYSSLLKVDSAVRTLRIAGTIKMTCNMWSSLIYDIVLVLQLFYSLSAKFLVCSWRYRIVPNYIIVICQWSLSSLADLSGWSWWWAAACVFILFASLIAVAVALASVVR